MTNDEIVKMMRQAGLTRTKYAPSFRRLVEIATIIEREACARVLDDWKKHNWTFEDCAAVIRARGQS